MAIQELDLDIGKKSSVVADALSWNPALEDSSILQIKVIEGPGMPYYPYASPLHHAA